MCLVHQIDPDRSEAFAEDLVSTLNKGALSVMISVGHRTGLFDVMSELPPATPEKIANTAGLNERYVREWLGAMVTGKVVECDTFTKRYSLPREHSAFLTRKAGANNIGLFAQYIPLLGTVEDKVVDCFKNGGGVPYAEYKRFQEVMSDDSDQLVVSNLLDVILPAIPNLFERLQEGINVVDLGCGRGRAINLMAQAFPKSSFTGIDLSNEAILFAKQEAEKNGLSNIEFIAEDLTDFHNSAPSKKYDFITTFDAVHDQARPDNLLLGIYKALKEDGIYLMMDISSSSEHAKNVDHPFGTLLYTISTMHCMTVSLAQGGMGLGAMWGREKALQMLKETGFKNVEIKNFEHDVQNDYYIVKK